MDDSPAYEEYCLQRKKDEDEEEEANFNEIVVIVPCYRNVYRGLSNNDLMETCYQMTPIQYAFEVGVGNQCQLQELWLEE
jgi:hypothetical protein